jgi:hypothetical protein
LFSEKTWGEAITIAALMPESGLGGILICDLHKELSRIPGSGAWVSHGEKAGKSGMLWGVVDGANKSGKGRDKGVRN